jgi:phosphoglycolate phosphatase-like HAD superfamily hydrolase
MTLAKKREKKRPLTDTRTYMDVQRTKTDRGQRTRALFFGPIRYLSVTRLCKSVFVCFPWGPIPEMIKRCILFCVLYIPFLCGEIIETPHFGNLTKYLKPETLVILDIDDTLLVPVQTLGNDVWFQTRLALHKKTLSATDALDKALAEWEAIRHLTQVKIVEEGSEKIVQKLQSRKVPIMGLTTQGLALATRTVRQLRSLNIDLSKTAPSKQDHYFINSHGVLFRDGVLFTAGTPKGKALLKLLEIIGCKPKQIVFVNDKESHLKDMESSVVEAGIPFIGLRYSYSDQRIARYSQEIADIQFAHSSFGHILSDEEAKQQISKVPSRQE